MGLIKEEANRKIIQSLEMILDSRNEEKAYTITIDIYGDAGAMIRVESEKLYEEDEDDCETVSCGECSRCEIEDIISFLKSKGYEPYIIDARRD